MTQRYFGMLYIFIFVMIYILVENYFPRFEISHYMVIWVMGGFYAGQYSMRYPKE